MAKEALVIISQGVEEIEAVCVIDILRRCEVTVCVAGFPTAEPLTASRGIKIIPDAAFEDVANKEYDFVILPGGMEHAKRMEGAKEVLKLLTDQHESGRWVGAVCAAPIALCACGAFKGAKMTSHPSVESVVSANGPYSTDAVTFAEDYKLITSRGAGTSVAFGLAIGKLLVGEAASSAVGKAILAL
eukprot:GCRY01001362.1.p1 GENE.GCRY01001362.1~~GCRY01001362.1.p1  ORF type:complete len:187 (-),score=27.12 GCRY01001362.1:247-807(-)